MPHVSPALAIRVLYRLRTLSEQTPFDVATFSYASPLLSVVLSKGSIALDEGDDPLEQVALAVDIVKFHAGECENSNDIWVDVCSSSHPFSLRACIPSAQNMRRSATRHQEPTQAC